MKFTIKGDATFYKGVEANSHEEAMDIFRNELIRQGLDNETPVVGSVVQMTSDDVRVFQEGVKFGLPFTVVDDVLISYDVSDADKKLKENLGAVNNIGYIFGIAIFIAFFASIYIKHDVSAESGIMALEFIFAVFVSVVVMWGWCFYRYSRAKDKEPTE